MSSSATSVQEAAEHGVESSGHSHPTERDYIKIAIILAVITALEVGTYFWEDLFGSAPSTTALIASLFPMMIAKFAIVIGYFMHLKYDNPLFKRIFVFGLVLAIIVYVAVLSAFEFFDDRFFRFLS